MDTELITAQEFEWVVNNEPSFHIEGRSFVGKVGRTSSGKDILIEIKLPEEFYPVVKPTVRMRSKIEHPNIDSNGELALQLLDEWDPKYRVKDIIVTARRLFLKSKQLVQEQATTPITSKPLPNQSSEITELQNKISYLQQELSKYSQEINQVKAEKLGNEKIKSALGQNAIPISARNELIATHKALTDLLGLIEYKFEDASMDEIVFFRLYKKYIREYYIVSKKLEAEGGEVTNVVSKQKTKEAIRN